MNVGKAVLAQIMDFVSRYEFNKCIDKYNGNYKFRTPDLSQAVMSRF